MAGKGLERFGFVRHAALVEILPKRSWWNFHAINELSDIGPCFRISIARDYPNRESEPWRMKHDGADQRSSRYGSS